ncbi:MAG: lipoprotein insertase outer membrane protein LolB [Methylophilaceae bacterium]|jgi:outer membrane biogenesis lipoprotein LolB|nr:lipoprotein insertase outer membrane protein LolB [Methylophilaceae bacterium]
MKIVLILFLLPIIIGCANIQQSKNDIPLNYSEYKERLEIPKIKNFHLSGKIFLYVKEKGLSGRMRWVSMNGHDAVEIYDPFNSIIAKVSLTESPRKISFESPSHSKETKNVIKHIFGSSDNVFILKKFLLSPPEELTKNQNVSISFDGWTIRFSGIQDNIRKTPKMVEYTKGNISLKIFINDLKI